ncbi:IclR family transcriptional regulator [Bordetella petrii]|uniref:IclR family transcriptional regulator n=1 Tax=Bordetella petrii TaxID=94624 RepID=UPI001E63175D|nr:IclR family transcriptional regulator [Bordetella petrii]MCD0504248.1 IclR family transcriptional regulator [Bordetella petrii]
MDKTLLKGLMVLETVSKHDGRMPNLDEVAQMCGLSRSNAHRTLQTLAHAGYVVRDQDTGGYRSTLKMFELGARQLTSMDVRNLATPLMRALAAQTGETVHLSVLDGLDVVYIDKIDSPQPIRAYSVIGGRAPAYAVATGKALLAFQQGGYLAHYKSQLQSHTRLTRTSEQALKQELADVALKGYAINRGEWRDGIGGAASPIFSGLGRPVAALGISGPLDRLTPAKMKQYVPLILDAAADISRQLGYHGPAVPAGTA